MEKDFLEYLDKKHKTYISKNKIKNTWFIQYSVLKSRGLELEEDFYIAKGQKSRILIKHNNMWIDLTDADLIYLICNMKEDTVKILLNELKKGYEGEWSEFYFTIDSKEFQGAGINYSKFELEEKIMLEADFEIKYKDILFVLNMVINKDIVGESYLEKKLSCKLIERTIIKYISLILYYKFNELQATEYLNKMEYPLYELEKFLLEKMKLKKFDRKLKKDGFDKILGVC